MAYYIQRYSKSRHSKNEITPDYMGSSEFEFGSVGHCIDILQRAKLRCEILPDYFVMTPVSGNDLMGSAMSRDVKCQAEPLALISLDYDIPVDKNYFDFAKFDVLRSLQKAYGVNDIRGPRFKEASYLEYNVGYTPHEEMRPRDTQNPYSHRAVWFAVDYGVEKRCVNDEDPLVRFDRYLRISTQSVEDGGGLQLIWLICAKSNLKIVREHFQLENLTLPGEIKEEDIRVYDNVKYRDPEGEKTAKVVGILEKGIRLEREGKRFIVRVSSIVEIL